MHVEHNKSREPFKSLFWPWILRVGENYLSHFLGLEYLLSAMRLGRPGLNMNIFGHLHELQTYQQYKMAAI